jgi:hypothetical protein
MAAEHRPTTGEAPASAGAVAVPLHAALTAAGAGLGTTSAVVGVVTRREPDSLTVDVRRGGRRHGDHVTYRVAGSLTRVYKSAGRTTIDEIAVGDLVLVHELVSVTGQGDQAAPVTAARIHGLTPSRRAQRHSA